MDLRRRLAVGRGPETVLSRAGSPTGGAEPNCGFARHSFAPSLEYEPESELEPQASDFGLDFDFESRISRLHRRFPCGTLSSLF